jgi:regulatory protein
MSKITGLKTARTREKRVNIYVDDKLAISLLKEVVLKEHLKVGQELPESRLAALAKVNDTQRCHNAAARLLGYRPRSEAEIRQRLQRRGFEGDCLDSTIARLKEQGLIDDAAFARFWKENRREFSPRSRGLTALELKRKGLTGDVIEQAIGDLDDSDSAYRAALKRSRRLSAPDFQTFRKRLMGYLGRRGFSYGVISETTKKVWQESVNEKSPE